MRDATPRNAFSYRDTYDENWPLPKHLSLEQYRRVIFRPDAHFVDGTVVPRVLGNQRDYLEMGVQNIWLIDPIYRAAFTYDAAGLHEADPTQLTVPGTPISVDLTETFAALD